MINLILKGDLDEAYKLLESKKLEEIYDLISEEAFRTSSINFYGYFVNLLSKKEWDSKHEDIHYVCAILLSVQLCSLEGAYNLAIFHINKCIQFSEKIEYVRYLKHLKSVPDSL